MEQNIKNLSIESDLPNHGIEKNSYFASSFCRTNTFIVGLTIEIATFVADESLSVDDHNFLLSLQSALNKVLNSRYGEVC